MHNHFHNLHFLYVLLLLLPVTLKSVYSICQSIEQKSQLLVEIFTTDCHLRNPAIRYGHRKSLVGLYCFRDI